MRASELNFSWHFLIQKLLFPSIFLLVLQILCLRNIHVFNFRCQITSAYIYNQWSFLLLYYLWYGAINDSIPETLTLRKCMCMRASERAKNFFYILKLLFLSIFCRYIRYVVGTNDMFVGLHVPTNFQMYRQNSEKALVGGGGQLPPPPPRATLMV